MALGESLKESSPDAAIAAFEKAAALVPNAIGKDSPQALIAEVAIEEGRQGSGRQGAGNADSIR